MLAFGCQPAALLTTVSLRKETDDSAIRKEVAGNAGPLPTGRNYLVDLANEIQNAKSQILIGGWQINWDVLLAPGVRLYDPLFKAAQNNKALKIYVMPWHQHQPLQTYSNQTLAGISVPLCPFSPNFGRSRVIVMAPSTSKTPSDLYARCQLYGKKPKTGLNCR